MDSSTLSIIVFLVTTAVYYFRKPSPAFRMDPQLSAEQKQEKERGYNNSKFVYLIIYFIVNIICQTTINTSTIINACGTNSSMTKSIGQAALYTIIPWVFIFGIMMAMLIAFPSWKSAFSNVVGYYAVYGQTNEILHKLYENPPNAEESIEKDTTKTPEEKASLRKAAASIVKMTTNPSIIINYMVPDNYERFWDTTIKPLLKEEYTINEEAKANLPIMKKALFDLVILRDNIGESIWYIYTGLLLSIIIPYNIAKKGCKKDPQSLTDSIQSYKDQQAQAVQDEAAANSTVYIS